jgi:hypothetical protein
MRSTILHAAAAILFMAAPAGAQTYGPADMNIAMSPDGTITAHFGQSGIVAGMFTHIYEFTLPSNGLASGTITTSAVVFQGVDDLDLLSVTFNGTALTGMMSGLNEVVFANAVPIVAGALNNITIEGLSRGNGSYGGQGAFAPSPAPEPAAWGMMIGGFALAGFAARRRIRVRYASA